MTEAAQYSAIERLRDGHRLKVRALLPDDRDGILKAFNRSSPQSLRRRFFAAKGGLTEKEIEFFSKVDFVNHVALAAAVEEEGQPVIVGGGRYVLTEPGQAEIAFAIIDQYQGKGIGAILMRHLATIAREAGLKHISGRGFAGKCTDAGCVQEERITCAYRTGGQSRARHTVAILKYTMF